MFSEDHNWGLINKLTFDPGVSYMGEVSYKGEVSYMDEVSL